MCLKRPITASFERSEPFHLLRLMGVSVPSLHIESTDSMICFLVQFCTLRVDPVRTLKTSYISLANINGFISELHTRLFYGGGGGGTASLKAYGTVHPSESL